MRRVRVEFHRAVMWFPQGQRLSMLGYWGRNFRLGQWALAVMVRA